MRRRYYHDFLLVTLSCITLAFVMVCLRFPAGRAYAKVTSTDRVSALKAPNTLADAHDN